MKKTKIIILLLAALYALACIVIYSFPEYFYYNPTLKASNIENAVANGYNATEAHYKSLDGTDLVGWYTKPETQDKIIVFFHGNSYNIEFFYPKIKSLANAGYGTFMAEYRGFGDIKGKISQTKLTEDSIAAIKYLNSLGYKNEDIILYGFSLGTYMAVKAAFELQKNGVFSALVLEAPFDNLVNVIKNKAPYFPSVVIKDKYDTASMINYIDSKILIMTGSDDPLVLSEFSQNLFHHADEPKYIKIYKGGKHNNLQNLKNDEHIIEWLRDGKIEG